MRPSHLHLACLALLLASLSCKSLPLPLSSPPAPTYPMDIHSHAEPNRARVTHVSLALTLDFERRQMRGKVTMNVERPDPDAPLVLDAKGLAIDDVTTGCGEERTFELGPEDSILGSALTITLERGDGDVSIVYHTTERADALKWLEPAQTAGGAHPFLLTQGQSILTRTWIPLQDSPAVRVTYDATIRAPQPLTPVMSAEQLGRGADGAFRFRLTHAIPPYLIALACGDLRFLPISDRCGVWAEPPVVERARDELSDTEVMIKSAEALFGKYRWGRYDLIILPPAFPFGGMENPCLTFTTPTILAGDRSLVALVAHELAHSWSGNLVTNATWSDFWLNEGFTVYLEQRIMEAVFGEERAVMEKALARRDLEREMKELEPRDQILHVDLRGRDPDDGATLVPYEKGALLLRRIEQLVGRRTFDRFLLGYFNAHAFQSITTADFVADLRAKLLDGHADVATRLDLDEWLYRPGLPADAPTAASDALAQVDAALEQWRAGVRIDRIDTRGWVTQQWIHFLQGLPETLDAQRMAALDDAFGFTRSGNSEILCEWLRISIQHGYRPADARLEQFLLTVGRRKFLKPLYTELAKSDAGMKRAREIYAKARPHYHAVATATIDKLLKLSG